jgi:hypothetical protein
MWKEQLRQQWKKRMMLELMQASVHLEWRGPEQQQEAHHHQGHYIRNWHHLCHRLL